MLRATVALVLALIHFSVPLIYYFSLRKWLGKDWGLVRDSGYRPLVSVVIPTYNEARFIVEKLNDVYRQNYPRDKLEIIVVDSASTDGTSELAKKWISEHGDVKAVLISEPVRRGKVYSLNNALRHASGEIIVVTDADAFWESDDALSKVIGFFKDPLVGAVSCLKKPRGPGVAGVEEGYREYYNIVRVAESKIWSTPIFHGELAAFRKDLLIKIGGFPTDIGSDDSYVATEIVFRGRRSIVSDDVWCIETIPKKGYWGWRIRRAQHLIQSFVKILKKHRLDSAPKPFRKIFLAEAYLHLVNPWLLLGSAISAIASALNRNIVGLMILVTGLLLLLYKPYRTWVFTQLYLIIAAIRNIWSREIVWSKQSKY
jgi:cellulose synthase/poly-beta-1,6-N-acetylglucosamine synthase-like glycosyltransferase